MTSRIAIVAADVRTALGSNLDDAWAALLDGRSALAPVCGFDASGFGDPYAAQIWDEQATPEDDPALRILGRHGQLLERVLVRVHDARRSRRSASRAGGALHLDRAWRTAPSTISRRRCSPRGMARDVSTSARFFAGRLPPGASALAPRGAQQRRGRTDLDRPRHPRRQHRPLLAGRRRACGRCSRRCGPYARARRRSRSSGACPSRSGPPRWRACASAACSATAPGRRCAIDGAGLFAGGGRRRLRPPAGDLARDPPAARLPARGRHGPRARPRSRPGPDASAIGRAIAEALAFAEVEGSRHRRRVPPRGGTRRPGPRRAPRSSEQRSVPPRAARAWLRRRAPLGHLGSGAPRWTSPRPSARSPRDGCPDVDRGAGCALARSRAPARAHSGPLRRAIVLGFGSEGGAGALVVEAAH